MVGGDDVGPGVACEGSTIKSLASWKSWWSGSSLPKEIAQSMYRHVDPKKVPEGGRLLKLKLGGKASQIDLQDPHKAALAEAILLVYPPHKDPSGYLLADSVLHLDNMLSHTILGRPSPNPMTERARRDNALRDGVSLKFLLSYIRNSAGRHEKGRNPVVTYLKELAVANHMPRRMGSFTPSQSSSHGSPVPCPLSPTTSTATTIDDVLSLSSSADVASTRELLGYMVVFAGLALEKSSPNCKIKETMNKTWYFW